MLRKLIFLLLLFSSSFNFYHLQFADGETSSAEEKNPILEAAKSFLEEAIEKNPEISKNAGMAALNGILQSVKNSDNKQIGDLLSGLNVPSSKNVAGDILTGIAGMLSKNSQNFDPKIIGQVAEVFSTLADKGGEVSNNEIPDQNSNPDWGSILGLASNLISSFGHDKNSENSGGGEGGLEGLLNLLPLLTNNAPSGHVHFADSELEDKTEHKRYEKSNYVPPFMHIIYEYWDHFKKSEFGETVWRKSGLEGIFQLFVDEEGYFQVDRIFESMENISFRRKWIRSLSSFVGAWVKHISDPATQARYIRYIFLNKFTGIYEYKKLNESLIKIISLYKKIKN